MIEHQTVVSVVHLEQRGAGELVAISVFYEATANETQPIIGIGESSRPALPRPEAPSVSATPVHRKMRSATRAPQSFRSASPPDARCGHQSSACSLRPEFRLVSNSGPKAHSRRDMFHGDHRRWRREPGGTADAEQIVSAFFSSSAKYLVMLTVECASVDASTHVAAAGVPRKEQDDQGNQPRRR